MCPFPSFHALTCLLLHRGLQAPSTPATLAALLPSFPHIQLACSLAFFCLCSHVLSDNPPSYYKWLHSSPAPFLHSVTFLHVFSPRHLLPSNTLYNYLLWLLSLFPLVMGALWGQGSLSVLFTKCPNLLEQCLAHSKCSVNICWMNTWMNESDEKKTIE